MSAVSFYYRQADKDQPLADRKLYAELKERASLGGNGLWSEPVPHRGVSVATDTPCLLRRKSAGLSLPETRPRIEPAYCTLLDAALVDLRSI
jgi:hypothetical protein